MKTLNQTNILKALITTLLILGLALLGKAQKQKLTILNIDVSNVELDPIQAGNLVRLEMEKIDTFEITDRYDVNYLIKKKNINIEDCYGKICQVEVGKELGSDLMLSGTIEKISKTIVISFRLIDVEKEKIIRSHVAEYLVIPEELQTMVQVSIRRLLDVNVSNAVEAKLTKEGAYESAINNPNIDKLNLSGPRSGLTLLTGTTANRISASTQSGGYNASPLLYMFGYQFEIQYLNEGRYQALFEFVPSITGFTGNVFRPSINILNGFRDNQTGWEFAFGPTFGLSKYDQYAKIDGSWIEKSEIPIEQRDELEFTERLSKNGKSKITTNLLLAFGKTFTSGKVNLPVNVFLIPSKSSPTIGITVGFNGKRRIGE